MGKDPGLFRNEIKIFSKARIAVAAAALILVFAAPALALADAAPSSGDVWKPGECATAGGVPDGTDCYSKEVPTPIMISVGGATGTTTLTKYISEFYKFATAGAAVLAVIYLMIGGFQILSSAGGEQVGEGRKKITNAILGLVLVFCSYVLLQTVNPALVGLQAPRIKLIRASYLSILQPKGVGIGDLCYTIRDKDACAQACVSAGLSSASCQCVVMEQGTIASISNAMAAVAIGGVGIEVAGGFVAVRAVVNAVGSTLLSYVPSILQIAASNWKTLAGAYVAYKITEGPPPGDEGVCLPFAVNSIPDGGECAVDHPNGCIAPATCIALSSDPQIGMCVSGKEGSPCVTNSQAITTGHSTGPCASADLQCCSFDGGGSFSDFFTGSNNPGTCYKLTSCDQRTEGMNCSSDSQCAGGKCSLTGTGSNVMKTCVTSGTTTTCFTNDDCREKNTYCPVQSFSPGGSVDQTSADYKALETCHPKQGKGDPCCLDSDCTSGNCTSSKKCTLIVQGGTFSYGGVGACY
jgi:hypothetical protein